MPYTSRTRETLDTAPPAPPGLQVTAYGYRPTGRRKRWLLVVRCPWCSGWHAHRDTEPYGGARISGCGRPYNLRVIVCTA